MYKTILMHVDGSPRQQSRMRAAARLAREHEAHLVGTAATGISWMDFALLTGSAGAPIPADDFTALRERTAASLRDFADQAARLGVASVETRPVEDLADYALLLQARYADLVVLSQDAGGKPAPDRAARARGLPERVCLHGPRPVLLVPDSYTDAALDGNVVLGWDGGVCALRAIAAALPLLRRAASVKLAVINPDTQSELHGEQPGADMALYLARHGVRVDVAVEWTRHTVGEALVGLALRCGAGLIVSGAYGHSRFREWVLGGVTRELLERTPLPLLIAH